MALTALGTGVGYSESEWTTDEGQKRTSRKFVVSTGDSVEEISISEEDFGALSEDDRGRLQVPGQPVFCKVKVGAFGDNRGGAKLSLRLLDLEFLTYAELRDRGFEVAFYTEEAPASSPSSNGATSKASA